MIRVPIFLPHHAVLRQASVTTKCRIVFDASARTTSNVSLNQMLLVGATVQDDLFGIVLRLRLRKYVLSADVKMMYRNYQKILLRCDKTQPVSVYRLNTVTYGMASAPFLATRCLAELANIYEKEYPRTCKLIRNSFYMDDLLVSLESIEEALAVYKELTKILGTRYRWLRTKSGHQTNLLL